jgi:hypothetical protein
MLRRDFCKISGLCLLALPVLGWDSPGPSPPSPRESTLWIHGSPYLGHSDYRKDFRGLSPDEIKKEIVHFRTEEPWRRAILFGLRNAS